MSADDVLEWLPRRGRLGRDHALARALWASGWHEARVLAALIDNPSLLSRRHMDGWARDFDNWAVCDAACLHPFVRTPHAWDTFRSVLPMAEGAASDGRSMVARA